MRHGMRLTALLFCFVSLTAWAQLEVLDNQTRSTLSTTAPGTNFGSPLISIGSMGTVVAWSIISETNNMPIGDVGASELFFAIDNSGQLSVLQDLSRLVDAANTSVTATLTVRVYDDQGVTDDGDVVVTVVRNQAVPIIPSGQSRNVLVTADVGSSVGQALTASGDPDSWYIDSVDNYADRVVDNVDQDERFFDINNSGQILVLQSLDRFFTAFAARGDQVFVQLNMVAVNEDGASEIIPVLVYIAEGTLPAITPGQARNMVSDYDPDTPVGEPIFSIGDPTYWRIIDGSTLDDGTPGGFNVRGGFTIDETGQLSTSIYFDQFFYTTSPTDITLDIVAGNQFGESAITTVSISITVVGSLRCGLIPATQTRFIDANAISGDAVGDPIDTHGLDSLWIDAAWLDGGILPDTDVSTYFTIGTTSGNFGQIAVERDLLLAFDPELITKVRMRIRGHVFVAQCPAFVDEEILVYVLPSDAGTGGGGGGTVVDFSGYIDDNSLLRCIKETVGITSTAPLTADLVLAATHLDCACRDDASIADLDGIQLFTSLTELNLSNNFISDIRPLSGLTGLTDLRLAGNLIQDVTTASPLASLTNLDVLDMSQNLIDDSSSFATLTGITFLSLAYNELCEISGLVPLANNGNITEGDIVHLDGNHLLNSQGQAELGILEGTGAFITVEDMDGACPTEAVPLQLTDWPGTDVTNYADIVNVHTEAICNE